MNQLKRLYYTGLAVGLLGLFVGGSNLLRWVQDRVDSYSLVLGIICTLCAMGWLIYIFLSKKGKD